MILVYYVRNHVITHVSKLYIRYVTKFRSLTKDTIFKLKFPKLFTQFINIGLLMNNYLESNASLFQNKFDTTDNCTSSIQLWQFLLELLTDKSYFHVVRWIDYNGEFEFIDPERCAFLWGERKGNRNMNYSKLSRALRNYYSNGIVNKINGHQYLYKFMFDISSIMGYSVREIRDLFNY